MKVAQLVAVLAVVAALAFVPNLQDATGFAPYYLIYGYFVFFWIAQATSSSEPSTFCARTCTPSRTGSVQTRTFGKPSTCMRQLGQWPEQQSSPRRRWYLKLREKTR